ANGNVTITGSLVLGGKQMAVSGLFCTQGSGTFTMTNAADTLVIGGDAKFAGGSTVGLLTNGAILASGNVLVPGVATSFAPSGNSTLALLGTGPQAITGTALGTTTFQNVYATNAIGVTINTLVTIQGNATILGPVLTGQPLTINGTLTDPGFCAGTAAPLNGSFTLPAGACLIASSLTLNNATTPLSNTFEILSDVTFTGSAVALQAPLLVGGAVTVSAGNLAVNGQQFAVAGAFSTIGSGTLTMNNAADSLLVIGQATFSGGAEAGLLTNGTLGILQGLVVSGPGQFAASGNHTTYFAGPAYAPLIGCEVSCDLGRAPRAASAPAVRTTARATAPLGASAPRTTASGAKASPAARAAHVAAGRTKAAVMRARSATMRTARKALSAAWPSRAASARAARAAGVAARARAGAAGRAVASPRVAASSSVPATVRGGMAARAMAAAARLATAARAKSFAVPRTPTGAAPLGTTSGRAGSAFTLPTLSDTAVYIAFADTTGNQFANVHITGMANWQTLATTAGNMLVDTLAFVEGSGHLLINDTLYVSASGEVVPEAVELFGVLSDSGYFSPDTTIYSGVSQALQSDAFGDAEYNNVVVNSPTLNVLAEDGYEVDIYGSLFIVNSGQLRIGTPLPGNACPSCESDYVYVESLFETLGNGTLQMTDANDPELEVDSAAVFAGGSTAGLLTQGEIDVYGNFTQAGSPTAFVATSPNLIYFDLYLTSADTITFANPGYNASHFGDFYVETGDYYFGSNVFADGSLNTGCIACTLVHRVHTATPGTAVSVTSKGADVGYLALDGVSWDLQDGYPVFSADSVDFLNQDSTKVQFSIERGNTIPMGPNNVFSNWIFETRPQFGVGLYVQATQTDDAEVNGPLTISFASPPQLFGNFGGISTFNGAQIPIWNLGGGGAELSASSWLGRRLGAGGTSTSHAGTVTGGSYDPVRR
ncbi:MAG TPA: hypothetical protein VN613_05740, partial [Gemmatimonadaceae bacterium]|nr:hypothetical protein [Gemmatimonadaceae bacterium]